MSMSVVTTCNAFHWLQFGRRMASTYRDMWPADTEVAVYAEGFFVDVPRVASYRFPSWFDAWKARNKSSAATTGRDPRRNRRGRAYDYRYDCVRFAHKVAALTDYFETENIADLVVWADADTLAHTRVTEDWIRSFLGDADMAWLDRSGTYPECGFMVYNAHSYGAEDFIRRLRQTYESEAVFQMRETHDSYVIQQVVGSLVAAGTLKPPASLSGSARSTGHPFANGPLGDCLDHCKGAFKQVGRTPSNQLRGRRREGYWR